MNPQELIRILGPGLKSSEFQFPAGVSLISLWLCFLHEKSDGTVGESDTLKLVSLLASALLALCYLVSRPVIKSKALPHLLTRYDYEPEPPTSPLAVPEDDGSRFPRGGA